MENLKFSITYPCFFSVIFGIFALMWMPSKPLSAQSTEACDCSLAIDGGTSGVNISSLGWSNPFNTGCQRISGKLIIDQDFTINASYLIMMPGSSIVINQGKTLTLNNINQQGGIHGACNQMWRGIQLNRLSRLVMNNCHIRDAQYAVDISATGSVYLNLVNNFFDRNYVGIRARGKTGSSSSAAYATVINEGIYGNTITCEGALLSPFSGQTPTPGTRSYAGIELLRANLTLGSNLMTQANTLSYMRNGILADLASQVTLYDVTIENLVAVGTLNNDKLREPAIEPDGVGIYLKGNSNLFANGNNFSDMRRAVFARNSSMVVSGSTIDGVLHGIQSINSTGVNLISGNEVEFQLLGIDVYTPTICQQIEISGNILTGYHVFSGFANFLSVGITLRDIMTVCPTFTPSITGNEVYISNKFNGIAAGGIQQNNLLSANEVYYTNDDAPVMIGNILIPPVGITAGTTDLSKVTNNTVTVSEEAQYDGTAISVGTATNALVCNNTVDWMDLGISFFANCDQSVVRLNNFNNHDDGLFYYDFTMTGQQNNQGNAWNESAGATHEFTIQPLIDLSRYFVENCPNPPSWPPVISPAQSGCSTTPSSWFWDVSGDVSANCNLTNFTDNDFTRNDTNTAVQAYDTTVYGAVFQWEANRQLYKKLRKHAALRTSNAVAAQFWSDYQNTNVQRFDSVEWKLDQVYAVDSATNAFLGWYRTYTNTRKLQLDTLSLDFSTATTQTQKDAINTEREGLLIEIALADSLLADKYNARNTAIQTGLTAVTAQLSTISPSGTVQTNLKSVLGVWVTLLSTEPGTLTTAQTATLSAIAQQCVFEGGHPVVRARQLLKDYNNAEYTFKYGCTGNRAVEPTEQNGLIDAMLVLQPNPANEQVLMVWKGMEATSTSTLTVTNPLGATVVQHVIPSAEGRWLMPTASLPAGLYVVRIAAADGRTMTIRKLLIKH